MHQRAMIDPFTRVSIQRTVRLHRLPLHLPSMPASPNFLHVSLASRLMDEIERGLWAAGQRLPSVREMSRRCAVSVTTVLAAYRALEDRQAIESRPQKGFYVCAGAAGGAAP